MGVKDKKEKAGKKRGDKEEGSEKGKKVQRATSNIFAMFDQTQIQEFKEAFQLIDSDKDGLISKNDLRATFDSLGRDPEESELQDMLEEATGPLNFTMFLTIFGQKIVGTDPEDTVQAAFSKWDSDNSGMISEEKIRHDLMTWGDRFTVQDLEVALRDAPIYGKEGAGMIDYINFTKLICGTKRDDED